MNRCLWVDNSEIMQIYHDNEWGIECHDDRKLFEMICLEGAQAGLSWITILKKRDAYRELYHDFDIEKVASMSDSVLEQLRTNEKIVRNRLKIYAFRKNAQAVMRILESGQSLEEYIWSFCGHKQILNGFQSHKEIPTSTDLSRAMSKDLKSKGFTFVGETICYAFMQAIGIVNDHTYGCDMYKQAPKP